VHFPHPPLAHSVTSVTESPGVSRPPKQSCGFPPRKHALEEPIVQVEGPDLRTSGFVTTVFEVMPAPTKLITSKIAVVARIKAAC